MTTTQNVKTIKSSEEKLQELLDRRTKLFTKQVQTAAEKLGVKLDVAVRFSIQDEKLESNQEQGEDHGDR